MDEVKDLGKRVCERRCGALSNLQLDLLEGVGSSSWISGRLQVTQLMRLGSKGRKNGTLPL